MRKKTHQKKKEFKIHYHLQTLSCLRGAGLEQEPHQEPCNRQGPLPDLLPQTEHLSRLSSPPGGPSDHAVELRVRRMAIQLRSIGDELNATLLHGVVRGQTQSLLGCVWGGNSTCRLANAVSRKSLV